MKIFDICYGEMVEIDDIDRQLIHCLAIDGRASFSEIAAVLRVSDQTVARRYRRLRSTGVFRVVGLRARQSMRSLGWLLHLRCLPGGAQPLAEGLARRTDTAWVQLLSGDTEVLCTVRGAAAERDAVLAKLPRGGRIVAVSAHQLLHVYVAASGGLGFLRALSRDEIQPLRQPVPDAKLRRDVMPEPGELDLALFRELGVDGRTSHADLAKAVGWSESTVRRRMDQLWEAGMLYYDLELDLAAFGFHAPTWLWLSVPPSELAATGAAFAGFPEVAYAAAVTGAFNLLACAVCRDEEQFYDFLTSRVGSLRAVDRVETSPIIRTLKQASPVPVVGLRPPGGRRDHRGVRVTSFLVLLTAIRRTSSSVKPAFSSSSAIRTSAALRWPVASTRSCLASCARRFVRRVAGSRGEQDLRRPSNTDKKSAPRHASRLPRPRSDAGQTARISRAVVPSATAGSIFGRGDRSLRFPEMTGTCWNKQEDASIRSVSDTVEVLERRIDRLRAAVREAVLSGDKDRASALRQDLRRAEQEWEDALAQVEEARSEEPPVPPAVNAPLLPLREQVHEALALLAVPSAPRLIATVHEAFFAATFPSSKLTSLKRDEERSFRTAPYARPYYICAALAADLLAPARGLLAISTWPLECRVIGSLSPRVDFLRAAINVAAGIERLTQPVPAAQRLLWRFAASIPGAAEDANRMAPDRVKQAAESELRVHEAQDRETRNAAAIRARDQLDDAQQLFGARLVVRPGGRARRGT